VGLVLALMPALPAKATPYYSVRAGHACNTCHIEPTGWKNPPRWTARRCTLDCRGCHYSPTGGGMRRPAGLYYGRTDLAMAGDRPGSHADPEKYRDPGDTSKPGRFSLWKWPFWQPPWFYGWNPPDGGNHDLDTIVDRFGDIPVNPRWGVGGDFRAMAYWAQPASAGPATTRGNGPEVFPMEADVYGMYRPANRLLLYASAGLQGNESRTLTQPASGNPNAIDYLAVRNLWIQTEGYSAGAYLRAGRFDKPHGWMLPDHTSFIRRDEGFDQSSQVFGVEAGFDANLPYANVDLFRQGVPGWPGEDLPDALPPGYGAGFNAGFRWLAGQLGISGDAVSYNGGGGDYVVGPIWAINAWPGFIYLGEVDFKRVFRPFDVPALSNINSLYAYNEVDIPVFQGLVGQIKYDYEDPDTALAGNELHRLTLGAMIDPLNHTQLWVEWRRNYADLYLDLGHGVLVGPPLFDELLVMGHVWF